MSQLGGQRFDFGRVTAPFDHRLNASVGRLARTQSPGFVSPGVGGDARVGQLQEVAGQAVSALTAVGRDRQQRQKMADQQMRGDILQSLWLPEAEFRQGVASGELTVNDPIEYTQAWVAENTGNVPQEFHQDVQRFAQRFVFPTALSAFERQTSRNQVETQNAAMRSLALAPLPDLRDELDTAIDATGLTPEALLSARLKNAVDAGMVAEVKAITEIIGPTEDTERHIRTAERQRRLLESRAQSDLAEDRQQVIDDIRESEPNPEATYLQIRSFIEQTPDDAVRRSLMERFESRHSRELQASLKAEMVQINSAEDMQSLAEDVRALHKSGQLRDQEFAPLFNSIKSAIDRVKSLPSAEEIQASQHLAENLIDSMATIGLNGTHRFDTDFDNLLVSLGLPGVEATRNSVTTGVIELGRPSDVMDMVVDRMRDLIADETPISETMTPEQQDAAGMTRVNRMIQVAMQSGVVWPEWQKALSVGVSDLDMQDIRLRPDQQARFSLAETLHNANPDLLVEHAGSQRAAFYNQVNNIANLRGVTPQDILRERARHAQELADITSTNLREELETGLDAAMRRPGLLIRIFSGTGELHQFRSEQTYVKSVIESLAREYVRNRVEPDKAVQQAISDFTDRHIGYKGRVYDSQAFMHNGRFVVSKESLPDIEDMLTGYVRAVASGPLAEEIDGAELQIAMRGDRIVVVNDRGIVLELPEFSGATAGEISVLKSERSRLSAERARQDAILKGYRERYHGDRTRQIEGTPQQTGGMLASRRAFGGQPQIQLMSGPGSRVLPVINDTPAPDQLVEDIPIENFPESIRPLIQYIRRTADAQPRSEAAMEAELEAIRRNDRPRGNRPRTPGLGTAFYEAIRGD